ncbi:unnamed protein product [Soboliphyme baturini]|uniref:Nucleoporin_N domain-containing protein n=1 Tax=Soboliphyme baturini TaxID=241478 RepID=A0A183IFF7_9BILA|nr:unnamed protein product [Soboliphyme baturini]
MTAVTCAACFRLRGEEVLIPTTSSPVSFTDVKYRETAGCFTYGIHDPDILNLKNRFIIWRACGSKFSCQEYSLTYDLVDASRSFRFQNDVILPGTSICETRRAVHILVCTTFSVHRISFGHPSSALQDNGAETDTLQRTSVLSSFNYEAMLDPSNKYLLSLPANTMPVVSACAVSKDDEALFLVGMDDSSVLLITMPPYLAQGTPTQTLLCRGFSVRRTWSSLLPFGHSEPSPGETVVDIAVHQRNTEVLFCVVSRDGRVQLWSHGGNKECSPSCVLSAHLPVDKGVVPMNASDVDKWRIKIFEISGQVLLTVFVSVEDISQFFVLSVNSASSRLDKLLCFEAFDVKHMELIDFCQTSVTFWTLWFDGQKPVVYSKQLHLDSFCQAQWKQISFDSDGGHRTVTNFSTCDLTTALQFIFERSLFSPKVILKSVRVCCGTKFAFSPDVQAMKSEVMKYATTLGSASFDNNRSTVAPSCGAETSKMNAAQLAFMENLLSCCTQYHQVELRPLALLYLPSTSAHGLICEERFFVFSVSDLFDDHRSLSESDESVPFDHTRKLMSSYSVPETIAAYVYPKFSKDISNMKQDPWPVAKEAVSYLISNVSYSRFIQKFKANIMHDEMGFCHLTERVICALEPHALPSRNPGTGE